MFSVSLSLINVHVLMFVCWMFRALSIGVILSASINIMAQFIVRCARISRGCCCDEKASYGYVFCVGAKKLRTSQSSNHFFCWTGSCFCIICVSLFERFVMNVFFGWSFCFVWIQTFATVARRICLSLIWIECFDSVCEEGGLKILMRSFYLKHYFIFEQWIGI